MYVILELQTNGETTAVVSPVQVKETKDEAESVFHSILSYAAVSQVEQHTALILNPQGQLVESKCFKHTQE